MGPPILNFIDTLDLSDLQKKSIRSVVESTPHDNTLLSLYQGSQDNHHGNGNGNGNDGGGREEERVVPEPVTIVLPQREPSDISNDVGVGVVWHR